MSNKNVSGVYRIFNEETNMFYIGSSENIGKRFNDHRRLLRKNKHFNAHLQHAWNKYGENVFRFRILIKCSAEQCRKFEQKLLDFYPKGKLYNIAPTVSKYEKLKIDIRFDAFKRMYDRWQVTKKIDRNR